jgi:vacuolar-type H+-ATPase subunit I/STV1
LNRRILFLKYAIENLSAEILATKLTRAEVDSSIAKIEQDMKVAMSNKQFKICADMQVELDKLLQLRKQMPTTQELAAEIELERKHLEMAVATKNFSECSRLQTVIEELEAKIAQVLAKQAAEAKAAPAKNSSEFSSRLELEAKISETSKRLNEVCLELCAFT